MVVCEQCGAENRDRARYCRGCTLPLVAVTVVEELDTVAEAPGLGPAQAGAGQKKSTRPCPECNAPNPRRSLSCLACGAALGRRRKPSAGVDPTSSSAPTANGGETPGSRPQRPRRSWGAWLGGTLALALAAAWWSGAFNSNGSLPPVAMVAPEAGVPPVSPTDVVQPVAVVPALAPEAGQTGAGAAPAVTQLNEAVEEVRAREARKEAERVAAQSRARAARIAERQRVQEARILAAKEAEAAAAAAAEAQRKAVAAAAAAVPAPPPALAPRLVKTVEQTCAGETNIFARDFCRIDACKQPANVNDAICISYRRMEAERRARMAN